MNAKRDNKDDNVDDEGGQWLRKDGQRRRIMERSLFSRTKSRRVVGSPAEQRSAADVDVGIVVFA